MTFTDGRISIRCDNESLGQVFDQIKAATGVELILDGSVRNTRLTAVLVDEPVNLALERLLEGTGLNYVMLMDRTNWQRVAKMYIGSGQGSSGPASARAPVPASRPLPREVEEEEPYEEPVQEDFGGEVADAPEEQT